MKHVLTALITLVRARRVAAIGLFGCLMLAIMPLGCANSIEMAPLRYRAQHQNDRHLLPDLTVERLQACLEEFGDQLQSESIRVEATVQVDDEGRNLGVKVVEGIPDSAPDLITCTRIALRNMAVPESVHRLRPEQTVGMTNGQTKPMGNALANPIVAWEIAVALAELATQHGGKVALFTVTMEVLSAAAIAAVAVALKKRKKKTCQEHLSDCLMTAINDGKGNNWNTRRCKTCFDQCRDNNWPDSVPFLEGPLTCIY